jgi:hypothetical protein
MSAAEITAPGAQTCREEELPVNPFLALRVSYGMLLGEEDFRVLMGNPRGKQMLHASWLHGTGVVWGYKVAKQGTKELRVKPGLAIDALGRELLLDADQCIDVEKWLDSLKSKGEVSGDRKVTACLVAELDTCLTAPVPALADPCDLSRKHTDCSRAVETVHLELRLGDCPGLDPAPYHRLRVLLGLDRVGEHDPAGEEARERARQVARKRPDERARALLRAFRAMAALDVADLTPATEEGDVCPSLFPATEEASAVPLAKVTVTIRDTGSCSEITAIDVDPGVRRSLIAASTIQELTCGLAPETLGADTEQDAGGPRVDPESLRWSDSANRFEVTVTAPLLEGSLRDHPVEVTSLSEEGWVVEDIRRVAFHPDRRSLSVLFHDPPAYDLVRIIIRGTGPTPVFGAVNRVPLAGLVGGPPGTANDGHDAVLTTTIHRRAAQ